MEELFGKIIKAQGEDDLDKIVLNDKYLSNASNWIPYGKSKNNFGTFEIQQPHPIAAIVEKIVNSIDSILLKECKLRNIDPRSIDAPKSMSEAIMQFFNIKNGNFSELDKIDRRQLAQKIHVLAEGDKDRPNIYVIDDGEGQHPDNFENTFLSIAEGNKSGINFVQGKYNFGSTGAVVFCGEKRYQLIASRMNDKIFSSNEKYKNNELGFTLIRRRPHHLISNNNPAWYEYFVINDKIPRFNSGKLDLKYDQYNINFDSGSIIKLYSYQLPPGAKSDISRGLWEELNQFLYAPGLPIVLTDIRFSRNPIKTPPKPMLGNYTRLLIDEKEKVEKEVNINIQDSDIGTLNIQCFIFKNKDEANSFIKKKAHYIHN
jgi:hypothetical protein